MFLLGFGRLGVGSKDLRLVRKLVRNTEAELTGPTSRLNGSVAAGEPTYVGGN